MAENKKATAPASSVGADGKQPLCKTKKQSIADLPDKGNLQATKNNGAGQSGQEKLQTVTMEELYDTVYPPKVPIVNGLIYNGTYLFVGAPKVGKSFFMAQLGYHVSRGIPLWDIRLIKGRCCIWLWRMIMADCKSGYHGCLVWKAPVISILQQGLNL